MNPGTKIAIGYLRKANLEMNPTSQKIKERGQATVFDDVVGFLIKYSITYCVFEFTEHESNFHSIASREDHPNFK